MKHYVFINSYLVRLISTCTTYSRAARACLMWSWHQWDLASPLSCLYSNFVVFILSEARLVRLPISRQTLFKSQQAGWIFPLWTVLPACGDEKLLKRARLATIINCPHINISHRHSREEATEHKFAILLISFPFRWKDIAYPEVTIYTNAFGLLLFLNIYYPWHATMSPGFKVKTQL